MTESVHNHAPYRPVCNERSVDGQLRGACLDDDGTPSSPAGPPESTLAAVLAEHATASVWHVLGRGWHVRCTCGEQFTPTEPVVHDWKYVLSSADWAAYHLHVAAAILAATPTAARTAELEAALAAAEARLRAVEALADVLEVEALRYRAAEPIRWRGLTEATEAAARRIRTALALTPPQPAP